MTKRRPTIGEDLSGQLEASQEELLGVAVRLARRLRASSPASALEAAEETHTQRRGLGESPMLEAGVAAEVLGHVEDALRGEEEES